MSELAIVASAAIAHDGPVNNVPVSSHGNLAADLAPPLAGLLVVDLSRVLTGPYATMMLGDLGARVIKIERPDGGDDTRAWGPPFAGPEDRKESTYFLSVNRNKESVALDLRSADDFALLKRLISSAD